MENIGFAMKRAKPDEEIRNNPETIVKRKEFMDSMRSNGVSYITNSIFVDEAEFKVHLIRRAGSTKRSEKSTVKSLAKRGLGITILAAVAYQGVEKFQAKMVHGGTPESVFIEFVKTIMDSLDQDNADPHNFIINNVSRNKFPLVRELLNNSRHRLHFLPQYSPFLNPIGEYFSSL